MLHTRDSSVGKATTLTGGIVGISVLAEQFKRPRKYLLFWRLYSENAFQKLGRRELACTSSDGLKIC